MVFVISRGDICLYFYASFTLSLSFNIHMFLCVIIPMCQSALLFGILCACYLNFSMLGRLLQYPLVAIKFFRDYVIIFVAIKVRASVPACKRFFSFNF